MEQKKQRRGWKKERKEMILMKNEIFFNGTNKKGGRNWKEKDEGGIFKHFIQNEV